MVSLSKVVGVMSCVFVLCLGLSTAVQADDAATSAGTLTTDQSDRRQGGQEANKKQRREPESDTSTDSKTITGEVLRVEGNDCFIKEQDGKEVRLHMEPRTLKGRKIEAGERIEAKVDDQNHVLAILSDPAVTDRRNDKQ